MPLRRLKRFASEAVETLLSETALASLDQVFQSQKHAELRHAGRAVFATELWNPDSQQLKVFVKLSWGRRRWWPRMCDIRSGQVFKSLAIREWEGLDALERLGFQVPQRLAILEEGLLWKRSAIVLKAVDPPSSISNMIADRGWERLSHDDRRAILEELVRSLWRMNRAGLAWRSISNRHVFPERQHDGSWQLWLIDCEAVHRTQSAETVRRDFHRFVRAMKHDRADAETMDLVQAIGAQLERYGPLPAAAPPIRRTKTAA